MKQVFATNDELEKRIKSRPPGYLEEIGPAILKRTSKGIWFHAEHPVIAAAAIKYRKPDVPIIGDKVMERQGPGLWAQLHGAAMICHANSKRKGYLLFLNVSNCYEVP